MIGSQKILMHGQKKKKASKKVAICPYRYGRWV